jgi:deoxyribonuclease-4
LTSHQTDKLFAEQQKNDLKPIFTHSLYLVNLASEKPEQVQKSIEVLKYDMQFDAMIKGAGIIVHLGSHQGRGWEAVRQQVAEKIVEIVKASPKESTFLIENSAGQNGKLCSELAEIRWLLDELKQQLGSRADQVGWCFDTCHSFAAGYYLGQTKRQPAEGAKHQARSLVEEITRLKLWSTLKCIHVNDSRDPFASGRDRHQNLGDGNIPPEDLKYLLNLDQVKNIPLILEVPGIDKTGPDAENISRLKKLIK